MIIFYVTMIIAITADILYRNVDLLLNNIDFFGDFMIRNETVNSNIPNTPVHIGLFGAAVKTGRRFSFPHLHGEIELLYISDGVLRACNDEISVTAEKGEIIFINSRVVHETFSDKDGTYYSLIQFDISEMPQNHLKNAGKYLHRFLSAGECAMYVFKNGDPKTAEIRSYIDDIIKESTEKKRAYEMYVSADIYKISALLSRYKIILDENVFFDSDTIERVLPVLNYIDTHYREEISLDDLSKTVNLNRYYFCRLFKKATNSTFTEYLNFVRVCKAEKRIISGVGNISEISMDVGFSSVSYFNRIFKKYKGCTPSAYKKVKYAVQ